MARLCLRILWPYIPPVTDSTRKCIGGGGHTSVVYNTDRPTVNIQLFVSRSFIDFLFCKKQNQKTVRRPKNANGSKGTRRVHTAGGQTSAIELLMFSPGFGHPPEPELLPRLPPWSLSLGCLAGIGDFLYLFDDDVRSRVKILDFFSFSTTTVSCRKKNTMISSSETYNATHHVDGSKRKDGRVRTASA